MLNAELNVGAHNVNKTRCFLYIFEPRFSPARKPRQNDMVVSVLRNSDEVIFIWVSTLYM